MNLLGEINLENTFKVAAITIIAILAPIQALLASVGFLIICDAITGVWASLKRKEKITSAGLRRTVSKMLLFQLAVITGFIVEQYVISNTIPIAKIVATAITFSELTSILENTAQITGKDIFSELLKKIGSKNDNK